MMLFPPLSYRLEHLSGCGTLLSGAREGEWA